MQGRTQKETNQQQQQTCYRHTMQLAEVEFLPSMCKALGLILSTVKRNKNAKNILV